jgi:biotin transport system substrate-specific component
MQSVLNPGLPLPAAMTQSLGRKVTLTVAATGLVALCAHISVPLPFTPVPITLQNFAVILLGIILGPHLALVAMVLYLTEGIAGLPVFSPHGLGGAAQLFGPTGGFLLSYPLAAAIAGKSIRWLQPVLSPWLAALTAGLLATLPIFALGAAWLSLLLHLSLSNTLSLGVTPFLAGEGVKLALLASFFALTQRFRRS